MTNLPDRRRTVGTQGHAFIIQFLCGGGQGPGCRVALHLNAIYYILLILTARIYHFTKGHFSNIIYKFIQIQSRNVVTS